MASKSPTEYAREIAKDVAVLRSEFEATNRELEKADLLKLRERLAVLEKCVAELERCKQETDKRQWQFVYITLGVIGSLLSGLVVQLLLWALKK